MWDSLFINYWDFSKQWALTVWLPRLPNNWWQTRKQSKNIHRQQLYPLIHNPGPCSPFFTWKRTLVQNAKFIPSLKIFWRRNYLGQSLMPLRSWKPPSGFRASTPLEGPSVYYGQGLPTTVSGSKNRKFMIQHNNNKNQWFPGSFLHQLPKKDGLLSMASFFRPQLLHLETTTFPLFGFGKEISFSASNKNPQNPAKFPRSSGSQGWGGKVIVRGWGGTPPTLWTSCKLQVRKSSSETATGELQRCLKSLKSQYLPKGGRNLVTE